jgi:MYXO-CTERM domain-containing protein
MMKHLCLTCTLLAGSQLIAHADPTRCAQTRSDLTFTVADLPELSADTGWFPSGSHVQARISGQLAGTTTVAMSLQPSACWNEQGMTIAVAGVQQGGLLDSEYGADLQVQGQIHASVVGLSVDWSGNIPLPSYVPTDLMLAGTTTFDPTALPGSAQPSVAVTSAPTSPVTVLSTNVLGSLLGLTGVSGDLSITAQATMTTSYHTSAIAIGNATITDASAVAPVVAPSDGYAGTLAAPISASGVISYAPSLVLSAHASVKLLGISVASWTIATMTLPLPSIDRDVTLTGPALAFALPYLDRAPSQLGFASGATQSAHLHNAGGAPLVVTVQAAPTGVTATSITVAPGQDGDLEVTAADPTSVDGQSLVLATNDPDHAQVTITLDAMTDGEGSGSDGKAASSSGCNAGTSQSSGLAALALAFVVGIRRRRR